MSKPGSVLATVAALLILAIGSAAEIDVQLVAVAPGLSADVAISGGVESVQIGEATERDVDAIVVDNDYLPFGLLGMSYLNRFDMQRNGSTLVLRRRR